MVKKAPDRHTRPSKNGFPAQPLLVYLHAVGKATCRCLGLAVWVRHERTLSHGAPVWQGTELINPPPALPRISHIPRFLLLSFSLRLSGHAVGLAPLALGGYSRRRMVDDVRVNQKQWLKLNAANPHIALLLRPAPQSVSPWP